MIAFDFDGTVADSMPGLCALACEVTARYYPHAPPLTPLWYYATSGVPFSQQLSLIFGRVIPECAEEFAQRKVAVTEAARPLPKTTWGLQILQDLGIPCALVSSTTPELLHAWLEAHELRPFFQQVLGYDRPYMTKTQQLRVLRAAGFPLSLFVGDSERDGTFALAAQVPFLRYTEPDTWTSIIFHASQTLLVAKQTPGVPTPIWP